MVTRKHGKARKAQKIKVIKAKSSAIPTKKKILSKSKSSAQGRAGTKKTIMRRAIKEQPKMHETSVPRQALGRGLSLLLSSTVRVPVEPTKSPDKVLVDAGKETNMDSVLFLKGHEESEPSFEFDSEEFDFDEEDKLPLEPNNLHGDLLPSTIKELNTPTTGQVLYLPLSKIQPSSLQPRTDFKKDELTELADSIKQTGLLQPILVRQRNEQGVYEIISGERRFRAAQLAGLSEIPAIMRDFTDREALTAAIVENVQRADLNPIEEALAYERLSGEFSQSHEKVAELVGKDRASVTNTLRLLRLPDQVRTFLISGDLTSGHARAVLMLTEQEAQLELAQKIIAGHWSVRMAEKVARELSQEGNKARAGKRQRRGEQVKSPLVLELEERIRRALGTKVSLSISENGSGELKINFFSREEFENLLERLNA